ncbi:type 1 fimbrial protein [Hafnia alvei]|uniref:fimbrial protein n=1 Tax=Hafnia alvei TaxID=569 RepID=UPI0010344AB5|nr:fimbrial protein [Hafnia alvei]MEB7887709.1 type 1 fimbrial protein [Hafnia alvei]TBL83215.1 type 1 fimbrial protein [Hafnia alvei]
MKYKFLILSLLAVSSFSALASDGDITFTGLVTASACTLNGFNAGTTTSGATMTLPSVTPASFSSTGGYAGMTDFTIDLKECDITTQKNAQVTFSGSPDTVDNEILKNGSSTNPATGVGVALLENDGATLVDINGGTPSKQQALSAGNTTLHFKVAYKANTSTPAVTAGNVSAKTFVDIVYN